MMPWPGSAGTCAASQARRSAWLGRRMVWSSSDGRFRSPRETSRSGPSTVLQIVHHAIVRRRRGGEHPQMLAGSVRTIRSSSR